MHASGDFAALLFLSLGVPFLLLGLSCLKEVKVCVAMASKELVKDNSSASVADSKELRTSDGMF